MTPVIWWSILTNFFLFQIGLREDFAKQCFETLLEFSLLDSDIQGC